MLDSVSRSDPASPRPLRTEFHDVLVLGSGFAGLCMAIQMRDAGIENFVVLERAEEIGGTWRDNHYPGCACDVQSHLYSFSFAPKHDWTRAFAGQAEIQSYLLDCVERFELRPKVRLGADMRRCAWDEGRQRWTVDTADGRRFEARVVVSAMGPLSNPAYPEIPGIEDFRGVRFHSADWDHDYDLKGKRVAVIGTGASAIQFVPRVAQEVAALHLYQRTPPWIVPKPDREFGRLERAAFAHVPGLQRARRNLIYWTLEARVLGLAVHPRLMKVFERFARRHLRKQVADAELRAKLTPDYTIGCKRILLSDDYYPALTRDSVEVVTQGIARATATGIVDQTGRERAVDAIIYGTGFRVQDLVPPGSIFGREGQDLHARFKATPEAYKGTAVAGFPNFFFLLGPNTGLGHSSMVYIIESQVAYVLDALRKMGRKGWTSIEVRPEVEAGFNRALREKTDGAVWTSGCRSWYLDEEGRNTTLWPDFTFRFRRQTAHFDDLAYRIRAKGEPGVENVETTDTPRLATDAVAT